MRHYRILRWTFPYIWVSLSTWVRARVTFIDFGGREQWLLQIKNNCSSTFSSRGNKWLHDFQVVRESPDLIIQMKLIFIYLFIYYYYYYLFILSIYYYFIYLNYQLISREHSRFSHRNFCRRHPTNSVIIISNSNVHDNIVVENFLREFATSQIAFWIQIQYENHGGSYRYWWWDIEPLFSSVKSMSGKFEQIRASGLCSFNTCG